MTLNPGTFEEVKRANKDYPHNQKQYTVSPNDYSESLIHQSALAIGRKFKDMLQDGDLEEAIKLTQKVIKVMGNKDENFALPLTNVLYRYDDQEIPEFDDQQLSSIKLLSNDKQGMQNLFKSLKFEMLTADSAFFMVSFIRWSGLQLLIRSLNELCNRGVKVKIITSFYMNITEPKALRMLLAFPNVEVRIFDSGKESFHTKAYLFERASGLHTGIIGSSNLSQAALTNGHEWNVKIPDTSYLPIFRQAMEKFHDAWEDKRSYALTETLLNRYEQYIGLQEKKTNNLQTFQVSQVGEDSFKYSYRSNIKPNDMQKKALQALKQTRENGHQKGVVIAATGTGKTFLSAFDVHEMKPKRMLFLAHREELLDSAKETFELVFNSDNMCGKLTGREKDINKPFLFSTVQSLHTESALQQFEQDDFDYIIVDEFHHAEAPTYLRILQYFKPGFLLGLTATPERMDGRDVLALCDYNVVYEIRLRDALEAELLAPFHYFGLADDTVDYNEINIRNGLLDERQLVKALKTNERVDYVDKMIKRYGYDGDRLIGLGFCATIEHAKFMSESFNRRGYVTTVLTGQDSARERRSVIKRLEDDTDPLQIIFSVNVFNEGVDIPRLNLILFLRPTESSTVFIQQLGRGLRKVKGKDFVTILDFIGNYQKSFIVPLALAGETSSKAFDKDALRIAVQHEFADLPGASYVDLDQVSQKRILERIDSIRMDLVAMLNNLYAQFKRELGRSPDVIDFLYSESAPNLHFFIRKFDSWVNTKKKMKDLTDIDQAVLENKQVSELFERIENMYPIKWPYELAIIEAATQKRFVTQTVVLQVLKKRFGLELEEEKHRTLIEDAMVKLTQQYKRHKYKIGTVDNGSFVLDEDLCNSLRNQVMYKQLMERVEYGIVEFRRTFKPERFLGEGERIILYQNYTRNDLIFLFQAGVQEGSWREGVSKVGNDYLLFINLNKDEEVSDHLDYKDYFIDQNHFHWQSQNQTSHNSSVGQAYIYHKEKGIRIHLFVRKFDSMHGMTLPFTYLGEVDYVSSHGDKPMNIKWQLHHPVPEDLFIDLIR